ncbi:MAG TPA: hypothetical protein VGA55_03555 [Bacteroidota bacterium]
MNTLILVIVGLVVYAAGLGMFIRFGAFVHHCDKEMQSMLDRNPGVRGGLRIRSGRPTRTKPRLKAA